MWVRVYLFYMCRGYQTAEIARNPVFLAYSGSWRRCGEPCLCDGAALLRVAVERVLHCKVEFSFADRTVMAASMLLLLRVRV